MAVTQEQTKVVRIVVDASGARSGAADANKALDSIDGRISALAKTLDSTFNGLAGRIQILFAGFLGTQGVRAITDAADAFTAFSNALKVAGLQGQALGVVQDRLFATANKNGIEIGALAQLYSRATQVSKELGATQSQMLQFVDGVTAALRVQGGSTEQASGALLQLSQALGSGVVHAQEFNSVLEGALPIAQAAARGMDGMGGSVAKLRAAVNDGKVTSQQFFDAMLKGFGETERQAAGATLTIGGALTALKNSWIEFVGALDQGSGASGKITSAVGTLAKALENLSALARAANHDLSLLLRIAANPTLFITNALVSKTPAEAIGSQIESQRKTLEGAQQGLDGLGPDDARRRFAEASVKKAQDTLIALQRQQQIIVAGGKVIASPDDPDNIGILLPRPPATVTGKDKGDGNSAEDKYKKLMESLNATASAQEKLTAAAMNGDAAYQAQETHLDAVQKAVEIFGHALDDTDPKLKTIEDSLRTIAEGKAAQAFIQGTNALRDENVLLQAQIDTMNEAPGVQAKIIAGIKAEQDARKLGQADDAAAIAARKEAIEQNETLKTQQQELAKAQELWTEPLKQALQDIQGKAADAFEQMLDSGNISFESLQETFTKVIKRMAAEFLALSTVRPVMSVLVQGLGDVGLVSPAMASQLGFTVNGSGGSGATGGSLGNLLGGGSSSMLGSFSDWLSTPIDGPYGGLSPADMRGVPTIGAGGLTPLGAIGGAASIGLGAYSLASGNTLGGAAGIIGGGLSLAASAGLIGAAFGPIGMGIGLIGGLLGGLLGGGTPPLPPQPVTTLGSGALRYDANGNMVIGGQASGSYSPLTSQATALGTTVSGLLRSANLTGVAGQMYGGNLIAGTNYNNLDPNTRQWVQQNYTQAELVNPQGGIQYLTYNDTTRSIDQQADLLAAAIFKANVQNGGVSGASDSLKTALTNLDPTTVEATKNIISMTEAYDKLNKQQVSVKDSIEQIKNSFGDLTDFANQAGLSLDPINAEMQKETQRTAQDFIDNMLDPLAVQMRQLEDQKNDALASAQYIKDNVEGVYVDMAQIAAYYTNKEKDLREQFYSSEIDSLQNLIQRLTYGDLSNASPASSLSGTKATYLATLAQAQGGDQSAIDALSGNAEAYVTAARNYFASSPEYQAIVEEVRTALANQVGVLQTGGTTASPNAANDAANAVIQSNAVLSQTVTALTQKVDDLTTQNATLTATLKRIAANM